jgi:zinc protease
VTLRHVLFGHGYGGELPDGSVKSLKRITLRDVKEQYKKLFTPDGAAIIVVGGIDEARVKKGLEAEFGSWKGKSRAKDAPIEKAKPRRAAYVVDFPGATQSVLGVVRRADGESSPDYFPAMIYNRAFGGAFTSRLNLNLREDKGYTYGASSLFERWRDTGFYALVTNVKTDKTRPSIDQMFQELRATCGARPLTGKERGEAVEGLLLGFPGRFEYIGAVAGQLADLPVYGRPADWYAKWPSRVKSVTLAEANAVAKKYCDPSRYVVVIAGDLKKLRPALKGLGMPVVTVDAEGEPAKKK